jgi:hypothetical protein
MAIASVRIRDAAMRLGTTERTLRNWMERAGIVGSPDPADARRLLITEEQLAELIRKFRPGLIPGESSRMSAPGDMWAKVIARLFADIMDLGMAGEGLLHDAGKMVGRDYAADWILRRTPIMQGKLPLPPEIIKLDQQYQRLEDQIEAGTAGPQVLAQEHDIANRIHESLDRWIIQLSDQEISKIWSQLLELDVLGLWDWARLISLNRDPAQPSAQIEVTESIAARPANIWRQHGITGRPVCTFLAGYLAGEAEILLGRDDLDCIERQCKLQGSPVCTFEIVRQGSFSSKIQPAGR